MFVAALFSIAKTWETTQVSTNRCMDREDLVHTHGGILLSHKKKKMRPFAATRMDLKIIILSE